MFRKALGLIAVTYLVFYPHASMPYGSSQQKNQVSNTGDSAVAGAGTIVDSADTYRIGPGDVLYVSVWKDDELTRTLPVLPDGTISFPLIGEIHAGDRTVNELRAEIMERIRLYVPEPVLSVAVQQVNSMMVYVIGRANQPGRLLLSNTVTALQALAMAGGPNPYAKRNKIKIIREKAGRTVIYPFPYDDIVKGEELEKNIRLKRGDVIVVP